jgi:hypothetical protein
MEENEKLKTTNNREISTGAEKSYTKITKFYSTIVDNLGKIIAVPMITGAVWGAGVGFGITEQFVESGNRNRQSAYERTVGEIAEKRSKFIMAGANNKVLTEFDAQNPQPNRPNKKEAEVGDYAKHSVVGAGIGMIGGTALSLAAVAGSMLIANAGVSLISATNNKKKEDDETGNGIEMS